MARKPHEVARFRRLASKQKRLAPIGSRRERARRPLPERRGLRAQEIALRCKTNRRRHQFRERQTSMTTPQVDPERDLSGHGHRQPARGRHAAQAGERVDLERRRAPARAVEAVDAGSVPQQRERVAAETVRRRLDDGHARGGRDGGIRGSAALLKDREPGARRDRHACRDDFAAKHRFTLRVMGKRPVEGTAHAVASIAGTRLISSRRRAPSSRSAASRRRSPPRRSKASRAPRAAPRGWSARCRRPLRRSAARSCRDRAPRGG